MNLTMSKTDGARALPAPPEEPDQDSAQGTLFADAPLTDLEAAAWWMGHHRFSAAEIGKVLWPRLWCESANEVTMRASLVLAEAQAKAARFIVPLDGGRP